MAFADDESGARDLLLSLISQIEREDRDDLMLEVLSQLGEIYLARGANDGVDESIRRIRDCVAIDAAMPADAEIAHMIRRYSRRAQFLQTGSAAAQGDHEGAATALASLSDMGPDDEFPDLTDEHAYLCTHARVLCATALCDDNLHVRSVPLWDQVLDAIGDAAGGGERDDHLWIASATGYGRFCVETGRLAEAEPWLRRAQARSQANGWELAGARAQLERAAARWAANDHAGTEQLVSEAYPVIARTARAHDVARCWLYLGLTRLGAGALQAADECWEHAERHWRELGKPLHLHRILLQRSWIAIFWSRFADAVEMIAQARELLDSSPRSSWLQYAQLDNHLGTVWRADALADLGFDSSGDPDESLQETEARQAEGLGVLRGEVGTPEYWRAMTKLQQAAELKVPAALAVDSVRYSIADAGARARWAAGISAPILAGVERPQVGEWASTATAVVPIDTDAETTSALAAAGPAIAGGVSLTRLGPLPPLQMQPGDAPILSRYRALALQRYGRDVTAAEPAWSTWP